MRITPKKTKYHFTFRNKIQTKKIKKYDYRTHNLNEKSAVFNDLLKMNAWVPKYPNPGQTELQGAQQNYLSHACTNKLLFGTYAIVFESHGKLTAKFVETVHLDIAKMLKKKSKVWLRICCDTPVTARPVETRMGKGKGAISFWEAKICPGQVFFEFSGLSGNRAKKILACLQQKCAIGLKLVCYNSQNTGFNDKNNVIYLCS